jgi:hypothetical protein
MTILRRQPAQADRFEELTRLLPWEGKCLEIAPFHRPTLRKPEFNVEYTDYATTEELCEKAPKDRGLGSDAICPIDFIWLPGRPLKNCAPREVQYDFVVASHVMEHVPDVLGWTQQILDVMKVGASLSLALPDHRGCFDVFRRTTEFREMLQAWMLAASTPTVGQIFDFLSKNVAMPDLTKDGNSLRPFGENPDISDFRRNYPDESAFHFAMRHFENSTYMDAHCSVFTAESFVDAFSTAARLGLLNIEISQPTLGWREFFVSLKKLGEPRVRRENFRPYFEQGNAVLDPLAANRGELGG